MGKNAFSLIGNFDAVDIGEADERFDFNAASNGLYDLEEIFGDVPELVHVHQGPLRLAGDLDAVFSGQNAGIFVVDGDLSVAGTLRFHQIDGGGVLLVTGDLRAENLLLGSQAHLWVRGDVSVRRFIVADLEDAGDVVVGGALTAQAILKSARGAIEAEGGMMGRLVSSSESAFGDEHDSVEDLASVLAPEFKNASGLDQLAKAVLSGKRILAPVS